MLACVEFKRGRIRKYHCEREDIEPGTYVLVDGDRGTDCGLLVQTTKLLANGSRAVICMDGCDVKDEKVKLENGRVIRPASNEDIERLHNIIANAEAVALKTCRQRCEELGIEINLIDVEYQFDMKKISFFFDCDHSVDFRGLVRELYRTFGARIWMENVNPKVKNAMPDSASGSSNNNAGNNNNNNSSNNNNNSNSNIGGGGGSGNNFSNGGISSNANNDNNSNNLTPTNNYSNNGSGNHSTRSSNGKERMHYDSQGNAPRTHHKNYRRRYEV